MPRIGLLSDTHGRADHACRAVALLASLDVDLLLHLGDVGNPAVLDALLHQPEGSPHPLPVRLVFGNTDHDWRDLARYARGLGFTVDHPTGVLALPEGGELAFMHGDDGDAMALALKRKVRYLCHGHTHQASDRHIGPTRVINPGALHRASVHSVAVLDTQRDDLRFSQLLPA